MVKTKDVRITYSSYQLFGSNELGGVVHKKSLPFISVVQSCIGSYKIKLDNGIEYETGEGGIFIAPSGKMQTITHIADKNGKFSARFIFLDVYVDELYKLDDLFCLPVIADEELQRAINKEFDKLDKETDICEIKISEYRIIKAIIKKSEKNRNILNREFRELLKFVAEHCGEKITVNEMAQFARVSQSKLFSDFMKYTGTSPVQYLNDFRLTMSAGLLINSDKSIEEIANSVGFCDRFYSVGFLKGSMAYLRINSELKTKRNKTPQKYQSRQFCGVLFSLFRYFFG